MRSREKLAGFIRNVSVHFNTRIVLHFAALEIFNGDEHVQFPSGAIKGDHSCHWKRLNFQKLDNLDVAFQFSIERSLSTDKEIKISFFFTNRISLPFVAILLRVDGLLHSNILFQFT